MSIISVASFSTRMVWIAGVILAVLVLVDSTVPFQIQDRVSQTDSMVNIGIGQIVSKCQTQAETTPEVESFIFNFWGGDRCYITVTKDEQPHLFNVVLSALKQCPHPCTAGLSVFLPDISCPGTQRPNTFAVNYNCVSTWQLPIVVTQPTTVPSTSAATSSTTTTATTTTTTTITPPTTTTTTITPPTTTTTVSTTTTPTTTTPTTTTPTTTTPTTTTPTTSTPTTTTSTTTRPTTTTIRPTTTRTTTVITTQRQTPSPVPTTTTPAAVTSTGIPLGTRIPWWQATTVQPAVRPPTTTSTTTSTPTSTTTTPSTTQPTTSIQQVSSTNGSVYRLVAKEKRTKPEGFLYADLSKVVCQELSQVHVVRLQAEIDRDHPCIAPPLGADNVEHALHNTTNNNTSVIVQPECVSYEYRDKVKKIIIDYDCSAENLTTPLTTSVTDHTSPRATEGLKAVNDAGMKETDNGSNLGLILGIAIPAGILVIVVPIVIFLAYKRRSSMKPLLMTGRNHAYGSGGDDIHRDTSQTFSYSQMNSAYSTETMDDNAMYQDPALLHGRPRVGRRQQSAESSDPSDSIYQDPNSLACTGPPGTPSPIRDALYSSHDDPSSSSEIYADVDGVRGDPDGKSVSLSRPDQHIYDMPFLEVVKPTPPPRNNLIDGGDNKPGYTHMVVTDGSYEPHNYAIIRKSRPVTDSMYSNIENPVQLYDSPVYNSIDDEMSNTDDADSVHYDNNEQA